MLLEQEAQEEDDNVEDYPPLGNDGNFVWYSALQVGT